MYCSANQKIQSTVKNIGIQMSDKREAIVEGLVSDEVNMLSSDEFGELFKDQLPQQQSEEPSYNNGKRRRQEKEAAKVAKQVTKPASEEDKNMETFNNLKPKDIAVNTHFALHHPDVPMAKKDIYGDVKQSWADIDAVYMACARGIADIAGTIHDLGNKVRADGLVLSKEAIIAYSGLANDIDAFTNELVAIRNRHAGKSGLIEDENEHALSISVGIDYINFNERFRNVLLNPMLILSDGVTEAIRNRNNEIATKEENNDVRH